jgi:Vacuolar protein sorting-associated protein 62
MSTPTELLQRHRPFLKYDSQETYFADSAAEWTDNPGNRLITKDGDELAVAGDGLSLAFLGKKYPDGRAAAKTDCISDPSRKYAQQARDLHARPGYANRVYGHVLSDGSDVWLQYWFFYFYNDYNLIGPFIRAGLHEGDWEMIQIHLSSEMPDRAVYAQHAIAEGRDWRQVDLVPGTQRPIVYVARGSHASYFEPGTQWTGHWFDHADGKRRSPELTVEELDSSQSAFRWLKWPGRWGDTKKGDNPLDSDSPTGPAQHSQWDDPLKLQGSAREQAREAAGPEGPPPIPPPPPRIKAEWHDGGIRVDYRVFPTQDDRLPDGLVVTVNSPDELEPPTTERFPIGEKAGHLDLTTQVDPSHRYDIFVSAATPAALASDSVRVDLAPQRSD